MIHYYCSLGILDEFSKFLKKCLRKEINEQIKRNKKWFFNKFSNLTTGKKAVWKLLNVTRLVSLNQIVQNGITADFEGLTVMSVVLIFHTLFFFFIKIICTSDNLIIAEI